MWNSDRETYQRVANTPGSAEHWTNEFGNFNVLCGHDIYSNFDGAK